MAKQERLSFLNFPQTIDDDLLNNLREKARQREDIRVAVAYQIIEEAILFSSLAERFFSQNAEIIKITVDEYGNAGQLILETLTTLRILKNGPTRYQRPPKLEEQVALLKEDPSGFKLLTWWINLVLEEFGRFPEKGQRQAALIGRMNGVRRYRELYQALI